MTSKCDTEQANYKQDTSTTEGLLRLLSKSNQKHSYKKTDNSKLIISMLKDATKHCSPNYIIAKEKGLKEGYVQSQANKKLSIATKNMSRDAWSKLAHRVSNMTDEELKAWIKT